MQNIGVVLSGGYVQTANNIEVDPQKGEEDRPRLIDRRSRFMIGLLLSNDRRLEREKHSGRKREERERKGDNKDDIAPLAAASALGKDGTAVFEGGKAGRQRKKGKEREKIRNEEGRKREKEMQIAG